MTSISSRIVRAIIALLFIIALVEFPRGGHPPTGTSTVTGAVPHFSWFSYLSNLRDLWHRIVTFHPGLTDSGLQSIVSLIGQGLGPSATLLAIGLLTTLVFGIGKGLYDGLRTSSPTPGLAVSGAIQWILESLPEFFLLLALEWFGFYLNHLGIQVYFVGSHQFLSGVVVPAVIIAIMPTMYMARMVRTSVEEQFGQPYLVTAASKGLLRRNIVMRHVLPNIIPTVLGALVAVLGMMISNLVIVEYLYAIPGLVNRLFQTMGHTGSQPTFVPTGDPPAGIMYQAFDAQSTLALILTCILIFVVFAAIVRGVLWLMGHRGERNSYTSIPKQSKGRWPWQLTVGGVAFFAVFGIGLLAPLLPMWNPWKWDSIEIAPDGGIQTPPFPPSRIHWLGTDATGYDLLSRVVHGIVPTYLEVAFATICVVFISTCVALLATVGRVQLAKFAISLIHTIFTWVPGVIGALLLLEIPDIYWWGAKFRADHVTWPAWHMLIYFAIIVFVEFGKTADAICQTLTDALEKSYMEAAEVVGNSRLTAFLIHGLRPLFTTLLEQFVSTFSRIILLMAVLGFFNVPAIQAFVTRYVGIRQEWLLISNSLDWSSIMSENAQNFIPDVWMLVAPMVFVSYTIMSLNLMYAGLRLRGETQPTKSRKRSALRLVGYFVRVNPKSP